MQVAPSQISPGESFDIFYFIRNHTDATTYYVRAKLYDVRTGELLDTQALDQSATNSRLFLKTIQAPSDPTGYGRNIVAIATVYTDSGYTTKSETYEEQEQYYLIKAVLPMMGGGGSIDMRELSGLVEKVLDKKLKELSQPADLPTMPWDSLFGALGALQREVNRIPKDSFDPSALSTQIEALKAAIESRPQFKETDLSRVNVGVERVLTAIASARQENARAATTLQSQQERTANAIADTALAKFETGLKELMSRQELTIPLSSLIKEKQPAEPQAADVSHLF
jgi:hypothetical protein